MDVLVIDIGGSHVKVYGEGERQVARFDSGAGFGPGQLVEGVRRVARGWAYEAASVGYPGRVEEAEAAGEPGNLGDGWVGFDFEAALGVPVRVVNDAVLQALGAYDGGRMLFLGLGTGLGSALVVDHVVVALELGEVVHASGELMWRRVGKEGLRRNGEAAWEEDVRGAIEMFRAATGAEYVLLGGGNARRLEGRLPGYVRLGGNDDAVVGGRKLWEEVVEPHDRRPARVWRVV